MAKPELIERFEKTGEPDSLETTSKILVEAVNELKTSVTEHQADYVHQASKIYAYKNFGGAL